MTQFYPHTHKSHPAFGFIIFSSASNDVHLIAHNIFMMAESLAMRLHRIS